MPFSPAPYEDVLQLLVQVALLLGVARLLGETSQRLGQPAVVGEIFAGVLLGPSVAGALVPSVATFWLPSSPQQGHLLEVVALIGVILLLVVTGLETDLGLIRKRIRTAAGVATGGLVIPFVAGLALGWWFPADLLNAPDQRPVFALFLAIALGVSAVPVLASILLDLGVMRRDVGQTMLAAGMIDDLAGWSLLGVAVALASGTAGVGTVGVTLLTVAGFVAVTAFVGPFLVGRLVRLVQTASGSSHRFLTLAAVLMFAWAAFSQALRLEAVVGAFAVGILLGRTRRLPTTVAESLESLTFGVFAPVFFAVVGLRVDIPALLDPRLAALTALVVGIAVAGKVFGAYAGGRWLARADHWTSLAMGFGLSARGAIGIVVATIGLSLGVIGTEVFSMIVLMAVATSLAAPPALKWVLRRVIPDEEEATRVRREAAVAGTLTGRLRRVLVAVRPRSEVGTAIEIEAVLLERLSRLGPLAVTVMTVAESEQRNDAEAAARAMSFRLPSTLDTSTRVGSGDPVAALVGEAEKGYDLIVLGATEVPATADALFGSLLDHIVRMAACPALVVRGAPVGEGWQPQRILVPVDGTRASDLAAELAFALGGTEAVVTALHVVPPEVSPAVSITDTGQVHRLGVAHEIVQEVRHRGEPLGITVETLVETGRGPAEAIVAAAARIHSDLVVMGTSARSGTTRLFLGPQVEQVLAACPCPVAVLNS